MWQHTEGSWRSAWLRGGIQGPHFLSLSPSSLTMHLERGKSQVFEFVKFSQVLTVELMSNSYYPFKSTFSCSMMKLPRPGPCLEELSGCFIIALVPSDAPLFQGVGWTHGSPTLVWLIDTFVLTHWHLQSRQSHLLRFWLEMETFTRCKISSSQGRITEGHYGLVAWEKYCQSRLTWNPSYSVSWTHNRLSHARD